MSTSLTDLIRAALAVGFRLPVESWNILIEALEAHPNFLSELDEATTQALNNWAQQNQEEVEVISKLCLGLTKLGIMKLDSKGLNGGLVGQTNNAALLAAAACDATQQDLTNGECVEGVNMKRRKLGNHDHGDQQQRGRSAGDNDDEETPSSKIDGTGEQPIMDMERSLSPESSDSDTDRQGCRRRSEDCTPATNAHDVASSALATTSSQLSKPQRTNGDGSPDHNHGEDHAHQDRNHDSEQDHQQKHQDHNDDVANTAALRTPPEEQISVNDAGFQLLNNRLNKLEARLDEQREEIDFLRSRVQGGSVSTILHTSANGEENVPPPPPPPPPPSQAPQTPQCSQRHSMAPPNSGMLNMNIHTPQKIKQQPPETPTKTPAGGSFEIIEID